MSLLRLLLARWTVRRARKALRRYIVVAERLAGLFPVVAKDDPMLKAIEGFYRGEAIYNALAGDAGPCDATEDASFADQSYAPWIALLEHQTPTPTTRAGALAALCLAERELDHFERGMSAELVGAALDYLDPARTARRVT